MSNQDPEDRARELLEQVTDASPGAAELDPKADGTFGLVNDPAERWPPLAQDHAVNARTSVGWGSGYPDMPESGDFERLHLRSWGLAPGVVTDPVTGDGHLENEQDSQALYERQLKNWRETRPGQCSEAMRWVESTDFAIRGQSIRAIDPPRAWEIARLAFPPCGLSVLEQLGTFFEASDGEQGSAPFLGGFYTDLENPLAIPAHGAGGTLLVRWMLIRDPNEQVESDALVAAPPEHIPAHPADFGLPRELPTAFAWGSPYATGLRLILPGDGGSTLRLFAIVQATGQGTWTVGLTARLAGWHQHGGPLGYALASAGKRSE